MGERINAELVIAQQKGVEIRDHLIPALCVSNQSQKIDGGNHFEQSLVGMMSLDCVDMGRNADFYTNVKTKIFHQIWNTLSRILSLEWKRNLKSSSI